MVEFLSDAWFERLEHALATVEPPPAAASVVVEYRVEGCVFQLCFDPLGVSVQRGAAHRPAVVFAQSGKTARALVSGQLPAPAAILAGSICVSGNPALLLPWRAAVSAISGTAATRAD